MIVVTGDGMKFLIVDDSNIIRRSISSWLEENGHEIVAEATNGEDAIEKFKEFKPELVTLDITMPKMNGLDALKEMLKIKPDATIIIISALAAQSTALKALELGAASYLTKPIVEEELIEAIDEVLDE